MRKVSLFLLAIWTTCEACSAAQTPAGEGGRQVLYNGIVLPSPWPPEGRAPARDPMAVPYLESPPSMIPIDVGRQLFVDDFLIEQTGLRRVYHRAEYFPDNPVLKPDKPWEMDTASGGHPAPTAMPFSDGVWFDPNAGLFKMWYMGGYVKSTCYAESRDGIAWEKPALDVVPGTNVVQAETRDSNAVWLDLREPDPQRRFKMFVYTLPQGDRLNIYFSSEGIHWTDSGVRSGPVGDRTTAFFNPFRNVWVYSIRDYEKGGIGRYRRYWEHRDVLAGAQWQPAAHWVRRRCDRRWREDASSGSAIPPASGVRDVPRPAASSARDAGRGNLAGLARSAQADLRGRGPQGRPLPGGTGST